MKDDWQNNFSTYYAADPAEKSLSGALFAAGHKLLESTVPGKCYESVLEVGAGSGAHLSFVKHRYKKYLLTESNLDLLKSSRINSKDGNIEHLECDATKLPFPDGSFDRIIACHVLEHLPSPHSVLREWDRVLKPNGVMSILLPTDPGVLWRVCRIFARKKATKQGLPYDYIMAREHINPINALVALIRYYFSNYQEIWWPTRIPSMDINLFYCCHIKKGEST